MSDPTFPSFLANSAPPFGIPEDMEAKDGADLSHGDDDQVVPIEIKTLAETFKRVQLDPENIPKKENLSVMAKPDEHEYDREITEQGGGVFSLDKVLNLSKEETAKFSQRHQSSAATPSLPVRESEILASPSPPCFFVRTPGYYKKTFPLSAITGHPDHGFLTMVWAASDRASDWRPVSAVHPHALTFEELRHTYDPTENHVSCDDYDDHDEESVELEMAMAAKAWLEGELVNQIFSVEAKLLEDEIRVETTFAVPAEEEEEKEDEIRVERTFGMPAEEEEQNKDDHVVQQNALDEEDKHDVEQHIVEEEYSDDEDGEWTEETTNPGNGAQKRTRAHYEHTDMEVKKEDAERVVVQDEKETAMPPPTKRAKLKYPCVVPPCDNEYRDKSSLQRHVYSRHVVVSDTAARRACRLLWGEVFKGGRFTEVTRRYGEFPKGA